MKILLIDNSSLTPVKDDLCIYRATGEFALELKQEHDLTVFGQIVNSVNSVHEFKLKENSINVVGVYKKRNKIFSYFLLYLRIFFEIFKVDFVYIFYPSVFRYVPLLCLIMNKPYGMYVRGERGINSNFSKWIYKKSKIIFTVTEYFTNKINLVVGKKAAYTIRPMIQFTEKDIVFNRTIFNRKDKNLLFVGRIDKEKGVKELIYAIKELKYRKINVNLTLVGDGGYLPQARKIIKELEIEDVVSVKGAVWDLGKIKQFYLDADLYILPTYHEGFPRTLYEAMIFGTPIVTTFVGGIPSLMKNNVNCLEIKEKSVESIVDRVIFAINNPEILFKLVANGRNLVSTVIDSSRKSHAGHLLEMIDN